MISMVPSGVFRHFNVWAYDHRTVVHLKNTTFTANYISDVFFLYTNSLDLFHVKILTSVQRLLVQS